MKVQQLTLRNFRNIREASFRPDPSVNLLVGKNGQGKTSFIEALGFLSTLRSFRDAKAASVIQWGTSASEVSCKLITESAESGIWKTELRVQFQMSDQILRKASKIAYVNEKPFRSSTHYLSQRFGSYELGLHSVIFNPSDHDLVRGDPATRRAYLDRVLAAEDIEYLKALQKYQRVLEQRNALLKSPIAVIPEHLLAFNEALCTYGSYLTFKRFNWLCRVAEPLNETLRRIAPEQPALRMAYLSNWAPDIENLSFNNNNLQAIHFTGQAHPVSLELLEQSLRAKVASSESAERRAGHTLVGPHRDDWTFFLGDQVLKGHGSQGEVRSALLALKLVEIELFRKRTGHRPLFLLDDFSSELDKERRAFLLKFIMETDLQTFVTMTEETSFLGKRYWVSNGAIEEGM